MRSNMALGIDYDEKSKLTAQERLQDEIKHRLTLEQYRNKYVEVEITKSHDNIRFSVKDQGNGFCLQDYLEVSKERAFDNHGRGIALARKISFDQLIYHGVGNLVEAIICTSRNQESTQISTTS